MGVFILHVYCYNSLDSKVILFTSCIPRGLGDRRGITVSETRSRHLSLRVLCPPQVVTQRLSCPFVYVILPSPSLSSSLSLSLHGSLQNCFGGMPKLYRYTVIIPRLRPSTAGCSPPHHVSKLSVIN